MYILSLTYFNPGKINDKQFFKVNTFITMWLHVKYTNNTPIGNLSTMKGVTPITFTIRGCLSGLWELTNSTFFPTANILDKVMHEVRQASHQTRDLCPPSLPINMTSGGHPPSNRTHQLVVTALPLNTTLGGPNTLPSYARL